MRCDAIVGLIAYPAPPDEWIQQVVPVVEGDILLVVSDPPASFDAPYADIVTISNEQVGFGKARRLSMLLSGEFGDKCVVADGDGQYTPTSIQSLQEKLDVSSADVIIPQRENRSVNVAFEGEVVDREPFERLETLCAGDKAGVNLDPDFDCQPGGFAFRKNALPDILPTGDWLADWEVTVETLRSFSYETLEVTIHEEQQKETTFTWTDQVTKLQQIQAAGVDVNRVYQDNKRVFSLEEQRMIRSALQDLEQEYK